MEKGKNPKSNTGKNKEIIAAAYIRVSTEEQKTDGNSLPTQRDEVINYAADNGYILDEKAMIFEEVQSASSLHLKNTKEDDFERSLKNRPKLQKLLQLAEMKKFDVLILTSRDRLSRSLEQYIALNLIFKKSNISTEYTRQGNTLDSQDAKINRFLEIILASVAELEANTISMRVKSANRIVARNGYWPGGSAPYGYIFGSRNNKKPRQTELKISELEKAHVETIFKLYEQGYSYKEIANKLNAPNADRTWTKSSIETILKNELYTGYIVWDRKGGRRFPGKHEQYEKSAINESIEIIKREQFEKIAELRNIRSSLTDGKYYNTPFILKGKLVCAFCGNYLIGKNYGGNKDSVYRCISYQNKKPEEMSEKKSELIIKKEVIESAVITKLNNYLYNQNYDTLWSDYEEEMNKTKKQNLKITEEINLKIAELNNQRENIQQMYLNTVDIELTDLLKEEDFILSNIIHNFNAQLKSLEEKNSTFYKDSADFMKAIKSFFKNNKLTKDNKLNRILIDIIVDKIIVDKEGVKKIILNTPGHLL